MVWMSVSTWMIIGFLIWVGSFRWVYLESLWFPIAFIGFIMWGSRLVRFVVWNYAHLIERYFTVKGYFLLEVFLFPIGFLLSAYFSNPYLVWVLFIIIVWYQHGRRWVLNSLIFKETRDKDYKATILSIGAQIDSLASVLVSFGITYVMGYSYKLWHWILWLVLFLILGVNYYFTFFRKGNNNPS